VVELFTPIGCHIYLIENTKQHKVHCTYPLSHTRSHSISSWHETINISYHEFSGMFNQFEKTLFNLALSLLGTNLFIIELLVSCQINIV